MKRLLAVALGVVVLGGGALLSRQDEGFPHARHEGLFPTCEGCHRGVPVGDLEATYSITPAECAGCHDGVGIERVDWEGPEPRPDNLEFSHPEHAPVLGCVDCHGTPDDERRMAIRRAEPSTCFECHVPETQEHLAAGVDCALCHVTLAAAADLPPVRIAAFPRPSSHASEGFLFAHGDAARESTEACAICHTRDSCERCHLNAEDRPPIAGLATDARVAMLLADRPGEWPEPPSHDEDWIRGHQSAAREDISECADCHAQPSCAACHGAGRPAIASRLSRGPGGVELAPGQIAAIGHDETFYDRHGTAAALGVPDCAACHTERQCIDCHDGVERPGFHPLDFVVRHAAEAFAERTECAACHSREAFCRDCHVAAGVAAQARSNAAFHDAQPDWLLAHGQAARQNLDACVACHQERSCLRCHSARTGWRVSPHGPDFDPAHVADKSTQSCAICHFDLPEGISP